MHKTPGKWNCFQSNHAQLRRVWIYRYRFSTGNGESSESGRYSSQNCFAGRNDVNNIDLNKSIRIMTSISPTIDQINCDKIRQYCRACNPSWTRWMSPQCHRNMLLLFCSRCLLRMQEARLYLSFPSHVEIVLERSLSASGLWSRHSTEKDLQVEPNISLQIYK